MAGKHIEYDRHLGEYVAYFDDMLIGFYATQQKAQTALNDYVYQLLTKQRQIVTAD